MSRLFLPAILFLAACQGGTMGARIETPYLHPMLPPTARPIAPVSGTTIGPPPGKDEPEDREKEQKPAPREEGTPAPERRPSTGGARAPDAAPRAVPAAIVATDAGRAEMVESARRVLGIRNSFDDRSFLGHVLRVNALLPAGTRSKTYTAEDHLRLARSTGRLVKAGDAAAGDIVIFECPGGCGAAGADGVAAGVVEKACSGRVEFISYVKSAVQRCHSGGEEPPPESSLAVKKVIGVVSSKPREPASPP